MKEITGITKDNIKCVEIIEKVSELVCQSFFKRLQFALNPEKYRKYSQVEEKLEVRDCVETSPGSYTVSVNHFYYDVLDDIKVLQ